MSTYFVHGNYINFNGFRQRLSALHESGLIILVRHKPVCCSNRALCWFEILCFAHFVQSHTSSFVVRLHVFVDLKLTRHYNVALAYRAWIISQIRHDARGAGTVAYFAKDRAHTSHRIVRDLEPLPFKSALPTLAFKANSMRQPEVSSTCMLDVITVVAFG